MTGTRSRPADCDARAETPDEEFSQTGLCGEAQADGVPCYELGRQCETCGRAGTISKMDGLAAGKPAPGAKRSAKTPRSTTRRKPR